MPTPDSVAESQSVDVGTLEINLCYLCLRKSYLTL